MKYDAVCINKARDYHNRGSKLQNQYCGQRDFKLVSLLSSQILSSMAEATKRYSFITRIAPVINSCCFLVTFYFYFSVMQWLQEQTRVLGSRFVGSWLLKGLWWSWLPEMRREALNLFKSSRSLVSQILWFFINLMWPISTVSLLWQISSKANLESLISWYD